MKYHFFHLDNNKEELHMEKLRFTFVMEDLDSGGMKFETFVERKIASGWLRQDFETVKKFDISDSSAMNMANMIGAVVLEKLNKAGIKKP